MRESYQDTLARILAHSQEAQGLRQQQQQRYYEEEQRRLTAALYNQPDRRLVDVTTKCQLPECDAAQQRGFVYCPTHQSNLESWLEARRKREAT